MTRSDVAIHLTLPYTCGWVSYKGLDFHFWPPPTFCAVCFCIFSVLVMYTKFGWFFSNGLDFYFLTPPPLILAPEKNIFVIIGSFYRICHFSCVFFVWYIINLNFNPPPSTLILSRYAPKSNQLLISMAENYVWNLVLIFTLVFELVCPQKLVTH